MGNRLPISPGGQGHVSENATNYYYANRKGRNRQTADGSGKWKSTDRKEPIRKERQIVGYKRNLRFYRGGTSSTKWVMTEYTLHHNTSHDAPKAICVIRVTAGNQRNEIGQSSTNPLLPEPDDEDIHAQLSPLPLPELDDMDFRDLTYDL
ncbi:putative NAC domain-containing protein 92 [Cocos nucifera]|uniref:Putative NAC domain-containing protein 92 n=1 Tax=Cocos nucifera TaxID=13894 RepID=A0A8K0IGR0_COCNU|nr:putative NAC domain-containing protein 92 [Cocos nucifera]